MQQILFKTKFSALLNAVKTETVQQLEEKIRPIKNIVIEKIQKKIDSNWNFKKTRLIFEKNLFKVSLLHLHTKIGISRTSRLGVNLYRVREVHRQTVCFIIIRDIRLVLYS